MASTIQVRVDDDLKKKSDNLFKELGKALKSVHIGYLLAYLDILYHII